MKQIIIIFGLLMLASGGSMAQINLNKIKETISARDKLSTEEVAAGLKEALTSGASKGSDLVSQLDGYYKNAEIRIPFPPEVKKVEDRLRQIGMGGEVDKFVLALNRAAEDAAQEAKPIFVSSIRQMTIQDAWSILRGDQTAATQFLSRTTSTQLKEKFSPVVEHSLNKMNATQL